MRGAGGPGPLVQDGGCEEMQVSSYLLFVCGTGTAQRP